MSTRIIMTIEEGLSRQEMDDLRYLLSDAVSEFAVARYPAHAYVEKRYPGDGVYAGAARDEKIAQVARRIKLAEKLHAGSLLLDYEHECPHQPTAIADYYKSCDEDHLAAMTAALEFLPASQFGERRGWNVAREQGLLVILGPDDQRAFWDEFNGTWRWVDEASPAEAVQ